MRQTAFVLAGLAAAASMALVGCDVQKTQEGNVTVPKYEVTPPDVNVTKNDVEMTVPKVTTEKKEVTVPKIEVKTGQEKAAEKQK